QHGGGGGRGVVGEALCPVLRDHAGIGQEVDVGGGVHGHHVGLQAVVDGARLRAGAAMGLVDLHILAGGLLVVGHEGGVVVLVELARNVVRSVQQGLRRGQAGAGEQRGGQQ